MPNSQLFFASLVTLLLAIASPATGQIGHHRVARLATPRETGYEAWQLSWNTARELADRTGRPLMLVFTCGDGSPPCRKLGESVFHTPEFARWSTDQVVKLEVDLAPPIELPLWWREQNAALWSQHGHRIQTLPTVLFVQPDGEILGTATYRGEGVEAWIGTAEMLLPLRPGAADKRT